MSFNSHSQCPSVAEICNNGIDDDCDGLIDCFDGDCSESLSCTSFYFGRDSGDCQIAPPVVEGYNLVEKWRSVVEVETRGTPIVGDLDGDGIPEVVTHFRDDNTVYILNGADGTTKATINAHLSDYSQSPSIVDADGDGFGEVYLVDYLGKLRCFTHLGEPKVGFSEITISQGQGTHQGVFSANPSFADFDGDGNTELFIGNEIYNASTGALISLLPNHYNESKGAIGVNGHVFSAAFDILPDDFCSDCSGLELICGNVVYSVNMTSGVLTEVSKAPNKVNDGKVSLADWDGDSQMDIIVSGTCCGDGGVIYIWDPRTQDFVTQDAAGNPLHANPFDVQPSLPNQVGLASIADFDGDGLLEIGMAGRHELITIESNMTRKWAIPVDDQSNMTTSTAFDFEGDGKTEVVYRDENNLYIIDGATGSVITQIPCGSGTRTELPVVVDVNGDGDAELVCTCSDVPGGGKGNVRVYESDSTIWVPTRKVWNTHNYVPTFINDDLTVPKQFQNKALIPGQDIYLTQTPLTYSSGNPVYPVLPDYTVQIDSIAKSCDLETATAHVEICQETDGALVFDFDVSFYKGDPKDSGVLIGAERIDHSTSSLISTGCMTIDYALPWGDYDLHVFVNDRGINPSNAPIILMPECDTTNNEASIILSTCTEKDLISVDSILICKGDTATIEASSLTYPTWTSPYLFSQINDSVIQSAPVVDSKYYVSSFKRVQNFLQNSDFEEPDNSGLGVKFVDAVSVSGWSTTDSQNEIEIWANVSGTPAYSGNQFIELNANDDAALFQDIATNPGDKLLWSFAHRGRNGIEEMSFSAGPPGGPYNEIGRYSDGNTDWGVHSGVYEIPLGQTVTRFYFTAVTGGAAGNFLDAIEFNSFTEVTDSVLVKVQECDCQIPKVGNVNSKKGAWQYIGGVSEGLVYELEATSGSKSFVASNGPEVGNEVFTVVYNTGTGASVSLQRHRYNNSNTYFNTITSYDSSPHSWTGLSGSGYEKAPILGYMAFIDVNGNGAYDSGTDQYIRDLNSMSLTSSTTGDLYMAFYDDGVYSDNSSLIQVSATAMNCPTDLEITKSDGVPNYERGQNTLYTIVAKNNGPVDVENASVSDPIPAGVKSFSWTAILYGSASNTSGTSGGGALNDVVNLEIGDSIVYKVTASVSGTKYGELENIVTINTPAGTQDLDSSNNIDNDIDVDPDPTSCFILMTDFEDYLNCPSTTTPYDDFSGAYIGNSAWVNSNLTAGLFVNDLAEGGSCDNIPTEAPQTHADGGTAYAGLHSPLSGKPTSVQEVVIGELPTNLLANQEYEISFIGISILVRNQALWDNYAEVDFFGIEDGTSPVLDATTQSDWTTISAIPEVDHLGTSATIASRTEWNEYSFKFTPTRDLDRLLLAPRGDWAYVGIDNIIVKVAAQTIEVDTVAICGGTTDTVLPYRITSGKPTDYAIDWDDAANTAGIADVFLTALPVDSQFVLSGLGAVPSGTYTAEITAYNTKLGCESVDSICFEVNSCKTDLGVTKTDGIEDYTPGTTTEYTIVVKNHGPSDAVDIVVDDPLPSGISTSHVSWDATVHGASISGVIGSQTGALRDTASIPVGDSIVYSVNIAVPTNFKGDLINVVTINHSLDTNPSNNVAEDINYNGLCVGATISSFAEQFNTGVKINPGETDPNWTAQWIYDSSVNNGEDDADFALVTNPNIIPAVAIVNAAPGYWIDADPPNYLWIAYPWTGTNNGDGIHSDVDNDGNLNEWRGGNIGPTGDAVMVKFSKTFEMTAAQVAASELSFEYAIDNYLTDVRVNGFSQGGLTHSTQYRSFEKHSITSGFVVGANTIDFIIVSGPNALGLIIRNSTIKALDSVSLITTDPPFICAPNTVDLTDSIWTVGSINASNLFYFEDSAALQPLTNLTAADSGTYTIVAFNEVGCSDTAQIYVGQNPNPDVNLPDDTSFCKGDSITYYAGVHDSIVWNVGTQNQTITVDSSYTYKVVVYNKFGCSDSDSVGLTVDTLPIVIVKNDTVCLGDTTQFTALSNSAKKYSWSKKGTGSKQITTGYEEGDYKVVVTDENSCKDSAEAKLIFHLPPVVTVNNDTICKGDSPAIFKATATTAKQYDWSEKGTGTNVQTSGVDTGRYTVIVTDSNSCKDTATGVLHVDILPIVVVNDTVICSNVNSINLSAKSSTAIKYFWGDLGSGTSQTISVSAAGKYSVVVTDENNCEQKDSAVLQKVQQPNPFEIEGDSIACEGDEIGLLADVNTQLIVWKTGEESKTIKVTTTGEYGVFVANESLGITCSDSASFKTTFLPYPEEPDIKDFTNCFTYNTPFKIDIPTNANVSWEGFSSRKDSTLFINEEGDYYATLSIYPQCSISAVVNVEEFCPGMFFVPNAFTPDGNSINDFFTTKGYNLVGFNIWIFNRWGEQIFTSSNLDDWWDGTYMGRPCQIDVYVWKAKYSFNNENGGLEEKSVLGRVSLIK